MGLLWVALAIGAPGASERAEPTAGAAWLGRSEAELRAAFGDALLDAKIEPHPASRVSTEPATLPEKAPGSEPRRSEPTTKTGKNPYADQRRLVRHTHGEGVQRVEYELFLSQVYRVRWQLDETFERPICGALVDHLSEKLGKPYYDQLIQAKFASGQATLRRVGWHRDGRSFEVRQLNPTVGGPLYLTISDIEATKEIIAAGGMVAPEPSSIGRWWTKPVQVTPSPTAAEVERLVAEFDTIRSRLTEDPARISPPVAGSETKPRGQPSTIR